MFNAEVSPFAHGTSLATKIRPSSVRRASSTSKASIPSSSPFVHEIKFEAPFDHCDEDSGSFMIKYDDTCEKMQTRTKVIRALPRDEILFGSNIADLATKKSELRYSAGKTVVCVSLCESAY